MIRKLFNDPPVALDEISAGYGPICALGAGPIQVIVVGGPLLIQQLFATPVESFVWAHRFNVVGLRFVVGRTSMIVSDGADHDRRRAPAQPAFARRRLNDWIPTIFDRTDAAIDGLLAEVPGDEGTLVDMYPIGRRLILGITLEAFFGVRFAARVDEIGDLYVRPQRFIEAPAVRQLPHPVPFTFRARVREDRSAIDRLIDDEIAVRRCDRPADAPDVLDAYLGSGLSDTEIRDQVRSLIGAGYDTTAATFAWMMLRAAQTPDVLARLRNEADDVLGAIDRQPTADHDAATLSSLVFASRVVREALRLHPAGLIGVRAAGVDLRLGDHVIRRGALIAWSPYLAGRDPAFWVEPLRFDPDRFADLTPEQKTLTDQAWLPFGRGPHSCLGFALAQMELTLIIARLAQRLDFIPGVSDLPRPLGMVVNRPEGGARLRVSRRVEE
jgi:cytochrome P450